MLEFILEVRSVISLHKEGKVEKEEILRSLIHQIEERYFLVDEGIALSDSKLRERLVDGLDEYRGQVMGAQGTRNGEAGDIFNLNYISLLFQLCSGVQ